MEKSPKISEESRPYEVGNVISPERREHIRSQTQKKILAAVFAGAFATGIFYQKPGPKPEARQEQTVMASIPEVTPITEKERGKQAELEKLIDELEKDVDSLGKFLRQMTALRKRDQFLPHFTTERPVREKKPDLKISGIEKAGVDSGAFKELITKTYPASWAGHLESISLADKDRKVDNAYGKELSNIQTCATASHSERSKQTEITFYPVCHKRGQILWSISHETGHAVDWESNNILSPEERMQFLKKLLARIKANDRFISEYVENIKPPDVQIKNYLRASEYWADIIREYLHNPPQVRKENQELATLSDKDIKLIEWFLQKTDPDFDAAKAWIDRAYLTSWAVDPDTGETTPPKISAKNNGGGNPITVTLSAGK